MTVTPSIIPILLLPLLASFATAEEYKTGYVPPTAEQKASAEANIIKVTAVLPNRLALQRVAAEQQNGRSFIVAPSTVVPAEDGAEVSGFKGALHAAVTGASISTASLMAYPRAVDNSAESWFPPIGNQQGLGSCASYSTVYYSMTSQIARSRGWNVRTDNNPAHIFSPRFIYNLINGGGDNGSYHVPAYEYMIAIGCATYADFPYNGVDCTSWPTTAPIWREALNYRMKEFGAVSGIDTEAGLANAKQMLADGYVFNFPGAVGCFRFGSFSNDPATTMDDGLFAAGLPDARRGVVSHCVAGEINHAMTIVGYNDDLWCDINGNGVVDTGEKGALRLANSWSANWQDRGFTWLSYDSLKPVTAVAGGYSGPRQGAAADQRLHWVSARATYTPSLVAEITVTHGQRNQMILDVGRGPSSSSTPAKMGRLSGLANKGGSWAFDGTTTPVAATFVLDCTDLMASGTGNRWFATLEDNTTNTPGTFTRVRFVDSSNVVTVANNTNPSGGLPKSVDNATLHVYADIDASPTVATVATATPNSAIGTTNATLSVLGADDGGESSLTYNWASTGTLPGAVSFSANNSNAAKVTTVTFTQSGVYEFQCTIRDSGGRTASSNVVVTRSPVEIMEGPPGYTRCASEGGSYTLSGLSDVAYGGAGLFSYARNKTGTITFNNTVFGDPAPGVSKSGYYKILPPVVIPVGPPGYTWCANEGGSYVLPSLSDVAYGGNGLFNYSRNRTGTVTFSNAIFSDPAPNTSKGGFYKLIAPTVNPVGPTGYTWCASEGGSFLLPALSDVAYGGSNNFIYAVNMTGTVTFSNVAFNGDPAQGVTKSGFYKLRAPSVVPVGPSGYTWCASEGGNYLLPGLCDVAYGGGGQFKYSESRTGNITFSNAVFGDPAEGFSKNGFYKLRSVSFARWSLSNNLNGGVNGDSDNDGIPNGIEYALQTNLSSADGSVATYRGDVISYNKRAGASSSHGISYAIEASKDLGVTDPWVELPCTQDESTIQAVIPKTTNKLFTRLRVVLTPL